MEVVNRVVHGEQSTDEGKDGKRVAKKKAVFNISVRGFARSISQEVERRDYDSGKFQGVSIMLMSPNY